MVISTNLLIGIGLILWGASILAKHFFKVDIPLIPFFLIFLGILLIFNRSEYEYRKNCSRDGVSYRNEYSFKTKNDVFEDQEQ